MHHPALRLLASCCDMLHPSGGWKRSRRRPNPQSQQPSPRKNRQPARRANLTYTEKRSDANLRILDFGPEGKKNSGDGENFSLDFSFYRTSTEIDANPPRPCFLGSSSLTNDNQDARGFWAVQIELDLDAFNWPAWAGFPLSSRQVGIPDLLPIHSNKCRWTGKFWPRSPLLPKPRFTAVSATPPIVVLVNDARPWELKSALRCLLWQ